MWQYSQLNSAHTPNVLIPSLEPLGILQEVYPHLVCAGHGNIEQVGMVRTSEEKGKEKKRNNKK